MAHMPHRRTTSKFGKTESIEEMFRCPICLDDFKEPRYLPCSHIFCLGCLRSLEQKSASRSLVQCPQCRTELPPGTKSDQLPRALIAEQMVERIPYLKTCSESNTHDIIDTVVTLLEKRRELKKDEENVVREAIVKRKEEIEGMVHREASLLSDEVNAIINSMEKKLLEEVDAKCEESLRSLEDYSKKADDAAEIKSWMRSNILNDDMVVVDPPVEVLPLGVHKLVMQFKGHHTSEYIQKSLDPEGHIRNVTSSYGAATARLSSPQSNESASEDSPKPLKSWESSQGSSDLQSVGSSIQILDIHETSTVAVGRDEQLGMPMGAQNEQYTTIHVQQWQKQTQQRPSHRTRGLIASESSASGDTHGRRGRLVSEPSVSDGKLAGKRRLHESFSSGAAWQPTRQMKEFVIKNTDCTSPSLRVSLHVTKNFTATALEGQFETKMWIFSKEGLSRRRHPICSSVASSVGDHTLTGIGSLPDESGWWMLLSDKLLVFDFHGVLIQNHGFSGTSFFCASNLNMEKVVFVDRAFQMGAISISSDGSDNLQIFRSQRRLVGTVLAVASGNEFLFVAQAKSMDEDGVILCFSGLEEGLLKGHRERPVINPPSGFALVSFPKSICCDQEGNLFVLWRDRQNQKGVVLEYATREVDALQSIVLEDADNVHAIACGPDGQLVTVSF